MKHVSLENSTQMKKMMLPFIVFFLTYFTATTQIKYETFSSSILEETREIQVQLPKNFNSEDNKTYPLCLVFDGDYMFDLVAGNVTYFSFWENMPEAIVVGINQAGKRFDDCYYSEQNALPIETGAAFFEFIGLELLPYLEKTYKAGPFKVAVGHSETANFINYYLLKTKPLFQGYIAVSPKLAPGMLNYLPDALKNTTHHTSYYLYNSIKDTAGSKKMTETLHHDLSLLENNKVSYNFKSFEAPSHYSISAYAIPDAIERMFKLYQPISKKEYREVISKLETSPVQYLEDKYQDIYNIFGIEKHILINDFRAISACIEKKRTFQHYETLSKLARKMYPETMLGLYYLARFYEEKGEPKKAMRHYQSAFILEEIAGITKDQVLDKAQAIKIDFGY